MFMEVSRNLNKIFATWSFSDQRSRFETIDDCIIPPYCKKSAIARWYCSHYFICSQCGYDLFYVVTQPLGWSGNIDDLKRISDFLNYPLAEEHDWKLSLKTQAEIHKSKNAH